MYWHDKIALVGGVRSALSFDGCATIEFGLLPKIIDVRPDIEAEQMVRLDLGAMRLSGNHDQHHKARADRQIGYPPIALVPPKANPLDGRYRAYAGQN